MVRSTMPLSKKPSQWSEEITAATLDVLFEPASIAMLQHELSHAVSRKPQKALWVSVKPHLMSIVQSAAGCQILQLLAQFGTPATVAEVAEQLTEAKPMLPFQSSLPLAGVVAAIAKRVDETKGARHALLEMILTNLSGVDLADSAALRLCCAPLGADATFGDRVVKAVCDKRFVLWLSSTLCAAKLDDDVVTFVEQILSTSAEQPEASTVITQIVLQSIKSQLNHDGLRRPRPAILRALCQNGAVPALDTLCVKMASWKNLSSLVLSKDFARCLPIILERCPASASKLGTAILSTVTPSQLATHSFHTAALLVSLRKLGLLGEGNATNLVDAIEDRMTCATHNSTRAAQIAIERELKRLAATGTTTALTRNRPKILIDDDSSQSSIDVPDLQADRRIRHSAKKSRPEEPVRRSSNGRFSKVNA